MTRAVRLTAASSLAIVTLLCAVMLLIALEKGGRAGPVQMAAGYDRSATQIFVAEPMPSGVDRGRAAAASRSAITQYPYDTRAWLRLSYVDALRNHALSPQGVAYLQKSYDLIAVDPDWGVDRIVFALENSQELPPSLRADVRNEASALGTNAKMRSELRQMLPTIQNPAGRLSLALWLSRPTTVAK
jgi:hypothetical protein